jgi:CHAT domain-containing protein
VAQDSLATLLDAIPERWQSLPAPASVPASGRPVDSILEAATAEQREASRLWMARLAAAAPAERPELIRTELRDRRPAEVDLWLPGLLVQSQQVESLDTASATLEAWLQWAEALGRKDVLLSAASFAVNILRIRKGASAVLPVLEPWLALPAAPGEAQGRAQLQSSLATILFRLGENGKALEAYRSARQLFLDAGSRLGEASAWRGEADALLLLGESAEALDAYRKARRIFLSVDSPNGQANTWKGEADVLVFQGRSRQALDAYRAARRLFEAGGSRLGGGGAWNGEADALALLGENQEALAAYRSARQLFLDAEAPLGQANTWKGEADALFLLGEPRQALDAYRAARQLYAEIGDRLGQGGALKGEADVLFLLDENQEALAAYRSARQLFEDAGNGLGQGNTWLGEARILRQAGEWRKAGEAAAAAMASYRGTGAVANQISALLLEAEVEDHAGDATAAAVSAGEAIRLHSRWRGIWVSDRDRTRQDAKIGRAYDILVPFRARQPGQEAEALRLAEEARSRALLDLLATGPTPGEPGEEAPEAPPLPPASIQALAQEAGPLLLYYAADREVWGFLVLPGAGGIVLRRIGLSWEELGPEIRALAHDLANPLYEPRSEARARRLWALLIAPFADRIPAGGPLVLVPHRSLHELPFEALLDPEGRRLFERWQVSVTPSASALALARRGHAAPSSGDSFLGFSAGRGLSLPAAEVAEISGFFGAARKETQHERYQDLATTARQVLIATRGVHTDGSETNTYLEIQNTVQVRDRHLTAAEIAAVPLQAELVTLAACDTSHGHAALLSDERLDLTRSFLIARAAAVLAARWKVPEDAATSRFLVDFYRAYRRGGPRGAGLRKDEALTEARRRSRGRGDPAQVWAGWVLVGDAR